ncbi:hypothetical protein Taro_032908, partial [Colocasia esculenta]|nr:hypothetical protein [Colocasia esculenta]
PTSAAEGRRRGWRAKEVEESEKRVRKRGLCYFGRWSAICRTQESAYRFKEVSWICSNKPCKRHELGLLELEGRRRRPLAHKPLAANPPRGWVPLVGFACLLVHQGGLCSQAPPMGGPSVGFALPRAIGQESMRSDAGGDIIFHNQLALTYSLHAHCAQETNQKTEVVILHDIGGALDSWLRISMATHLELENEKTIQLLCNIADLACLKGHLDFQLQLCKLVLIFGKRMNIPIERCVDVLWSNRRISHAFCSSPIDANFIVDVSEELGVHANLTSFWMSCMENSPSSLVGFLQIFLLSDSMLPQMSNLSSKGSFGSQVTVDEVKKVALSLVSSVPVSSHSVFAAGYLFFDLSERLMLVGQLFEALTYAREALRLRTRVLHRKFIYLLGKQPAKLETPWDNNHPFTGSLGAVLTKEWPTISRSQNLEGCIISPWSILKCYLESILQVGLIYESIGNGVEAEDHFRMGKTISCSLGFPVLGIAFSSHLGQVYRKKQLFKLAEDELDVAKRILLDKENIISCNRCKAALHGTIDLQIGDLRRSMFETTSRTRSTDLLSNALSQYKSALERLNCTELFDKSFSDVVPLASKERGSTQLDTSAQTSGYVDGPNDGHHLRDHLAVSSSKAERKGANLRVGGRRNSKSASCDPSMKQNLGDQLNLNACKNQIHRHSRECTKKCCILESTNSIHKAACQDICCQEGKFFGPGKESKQICRCNEASMGSKLYCWRCLLANVVEVGSMHRVIYVKWECQRRRLSLKLLTEIGKCMSILSDIHEVHEILWQSMSLLSNTELLCQTCTPSPPLLEFVGMENLCDIFPIQRAELLYNMGLFCVKECLSEGSRTCCALSKIEIPVVLSWLMLAFILAQEIPSLFQQVSRLIATILLLSMSTGNLSLPFFFHSLNGSQLAAFFHQASVGTYLQHVYISGTKDKGRNTKDLQTGGLTDMIASSSYLRVVPEKLSDLEEFVNNFFQSLPSFTVICISLLGGDYVNLLGETLLLPSFFPAWMLLSRLHPKEQPIVMLLPVDFAREEDQDIVNYSLMPAFENKESVTKWECPWGYTLLDYVAPEYKVILEENFLTLSGGTCDVMDEKKRRSMWWSERTKLNNHLSKFLRTIEDSWLGPWRCLLLGECSDFKHLDAEVSRLSRSLKSECRAEASMSLLKAILSGGQSLSDIKTCISQLLLYKGYLGRGGCCRADSFRAFSHVIDGGSESLSESTCKLIQEAVDKLVHESLDREPVVLVLDADLQMLPWENIPILRKQEVYRMPSTSSIFATLDRHWHREQSKGFDAIIPSIDPLDAYYLLNPSGDLSSTQLEFEEWFVTQKWEGKAGEAPPTEELADALQKHDLFLYFGHGSGMQYIPGNTIQKLDRCAATLLMGCSSGSLYLGGYYAPRGAPLSYLLAGSPAVIANLWDVSDKDIDRFGKAMLNSWLQERSIIRCSQCNRVMEECECLGNKVGNTMSVRTRSRVSRDNKLDESRQSVRRTSSKARVASFMSQARDACKLPMLIGAAPVCYGVPTLIKNNKC